MEWLVENWQWFALGITIASVVVKVTPNETDNKILEIIIKVCEALSLNTDPVKKKSD